MLAALISALSLYIPPSAPICDRFDLIEINHKLNEYGGNSFDQLIFWDWSSWSNSFTCQGWMMMKNARDKSDPADRKQWDDDVDEYVKQFPIETRQRIRYYMPYPGKFTGGPALPMREGSDYVSRFHEKTVDREIRATKIRETWTQRDPEMDDRARFPLSERRGLTIRLPLSLTPGRN